MATTCRSPAHEPPNNGAGGPRRAPDSGARDRGRGRLLADPIGARPRGARLALAGQRRRALGRALSGSPGLLLRRLGDTRSDAHGRGADVPRLAPRGASALPEPFRPWLLFRHAVPPLRGPSARVPPDQSGGLPSGRPPAAPLLAGPRREPSTRPRAAGGLRPATELLDGPLLVRHVQREPEPDAVLRRALRGDPRGSEPGPASLACAELRCVPRIQLHVRGLPLPVSAHSRVRVALHRAAGSTRGPLSLGSLFDGRRRAGRGSQLQGPDHDAARCRSRADCARASREDRLALPRRALTELSPVRARAAAGVLAGPHAPLERCRHLDRTRHGGARVRAALSGAARAHIGEACSGGGDAGGGRAWGS